MRLVGETRERLRALFFRAREDAELDEELQHHLDMQMQENLRRGMNPDEARRQARLAFGGINQSREEVRGERAIPMEGLLQDFRYAGRALRKNPGFTLTAVVTLALGIGVNTSIFSIISAVLLEPLALGAPERIVRLLPDHPEYGESDGTFALADLADLAGEATTLSGVAAYDSWLATADTPDGAERIDGAIVSENYFDVLGVQPALGRFFIAGEADPVVILSDEIWRTRFGGDPSLLGQDIRLNGGEYTVIGIAPLGLEDPRLVRGDRPPPQIWRSPPGSWADGDPAKRGYRSVTAIARLAPSVTLGQAQAEVATIFRRLEAAYPEANRDWGARIRPLQEHIVAPVRPALMILMGAVGLVLLIACANLANLVLARTLRRGREIAVRRALGASRARVVSQVVTEGMLLSVVGATLGVALAWGMTRWIVRLGAGEIPRLSSAGVDERALLFALIISIATVTLFTTAPAMRAAKLPMQWLIKAGDSRASGGRDQRRFRSILLASQAAFTVMLLVGAGLMIRSLWSLYSVDPGLDPAGILTGRVEISWNRYGTEEQVSSAFVEILSHLNGLPGVEAAAVVNVLPFSGGYWRTSFEIEGRATTSESEDAPGAEIRTASPGYFDAMRIAVLQGRGFGEADAAGATPVVVVNRSLADRYWAGGTATGRSIKVFEVPREIVGVVEDVREFSLDRAPEPLLYLPQAQAPSWLTRYSYLVVRTDGDPMDIARPVRQAIRGIDSQIPLSDVRTMSSWIGSTTAPERLRTALLTLFGMLAFVLAGIGIYGVVAYSVAQRTREIGIRMALGARPRQTASLLVRDEMMPVVAGILVGVAGALAGGRLLSGLLFGVAPTDPSTLLMASTLVALVALVAAQFPARSATRIDPTITLRSE
jgi:putative ABC transport system permease protein